MEQDCLFHCLDKCNETLTIVTQSQFRTAKEYSERWEAISEGPERAAAIKLNQIQTNTGELLCHYNCYKRFCNKLVCERAEIRERKRKLEEEEAATEASKVKLQYMHQLHLKCTAVVWNNKYNINIITLC